MSATSELLIKLLSYSATDLSVSSEDEALIIKLIRADAKLGETMYDLHKKGFLTKLLQRVDSGVNPEVLIQVVAGGLAESAYPLVVDAVKKTTRHLALFDGSYHLHSALRREGFFSPSTPIPEQKIRAALALLGVGGPSSPFSGSGSTGADPKSLTIGYIDQWRLLNADPTTVAAYSNPIPGGLGAYLATLTPGQRRAQAVVLVGQKIISIYPHSYRGRLPSRADICKVAGKKYSLEPALIAGFILAEQRDQSQKEDAKDYIGATSIKKVNTSIGLGQVVISTVRKHGLFDDLQAKGVSASLSHRAVANLLTSDEFNIFAVARYIRYVADEATKLSLASLPNTQKKFPGINLVDYKKHSQNWPSDNVKALGSEYTSRAWDDKLSPGWGDFVYEAYSDIKSAGIV
jgi:hypothetical protein